MSGPSDAVLMEAMHEAAAAVGVALEVLEDWGPAGTRPGQYLSDLAADTAALEVLEQAGVGVVSEESGWHHREREVTVVLDPVDGSTNASRGLPWYATSLCALDGDGLRAAVVVNQATGTTYEAVRGGGASCDGHAIGPSSRTSLEQALVGLSGYPPHHLGWRQFRAYGAAALDLCAVASGLIDAYIDCSHDMHGPWDYLGGVLVCLEAGAFVADADGRSLLEPAPETRRTIMAAATPALLDAVVTARGTFRQIGPKKS